MPKCRCRQKHLGLPSRTLWINTGAPQPPSLPGWTDIPGIIADLVAFIPAIADLGCCNKVSNDLAIVCLPYKRASGFGAEHEKLDSCR